MVKKGQVTCLEKNKNNRLMSLPDNESLDIRALEKVFLRTSESYKFFWMLSIAKISLMKGWLEVSYDELASEMILLARERIKVNMNGFKKTDKLLQATEYIESSEKLSGLDRYELKLVLEENEDPVLTSIKKTLMLNVPYRFLSPFLDFKENEWKLSASELIMEINRRNGLPYSFGAYNGMSTMIIMNRDWMAYMVDNGRKLMDEIERCFEAFSSGQK